MICGECQRATDTGDLTYHSMCAGNFHSTYCDCQHKTGTGYIDAEANASGADKTCSRDDGKHSKQTD